MGAVYKAWDKTLRRVVALKRLIAESTDHSVVLDVSGALREARTLAQISHPAILQVYDVIEISSEAWIVCEWLEGVSLEKVRRRLHPLSVIVMARELLSALASVHSAGVIHRDLKPSNIYLCGSGRLVLIDFGVAYLPGGSSGVTVAGTPRYSDVSRLEGSAPTECSDLFSAGLVLLESATGECVLPNLAPLPLYRFFKKSFDDRVQELSQGLYPPLIEITQSLFSSIDARGGAKSREDAQRLLNECMAKLDSLFHSLVKSSANVLIKETIYEGNSLPKEVEREFLRDSEKQLGEKSLSPRERAQWMSFTKNLTPSEKTEVRQPQRTQLKTIYLVAAIILAGAAASISLMLTTTVSHNEPSHTPSPASVSATQTAEPQSSLVQQTPAAEPKPTQPEEQLNESAANQIIPAARPTAATAKPAARKSREDRPEARSKKEGFAFISANAWADVYINSRLVGRLPMAKSLQLKEGIHKLRLINPMTAPIETTIRIKSEQLVKLHFNLVPRQAEPADAQ
jgi:serine/threonine protein kinase